MAAEQGTQSTPQTPRPTLFFGKMEARTWERQKTRGGTGQETNYQHEKYVHFDGEDMASCTRHRPQGAADGGQGAGRHSRDGTSRAARHPQPQRGLRAPGDAPEIPRTQLGVQHRTQIPYVSTTALPEENIGKKELFFSGKPKQKHTVLLRDYTASIC